MLRGAGLRVTAAGLVRRFQPSGSVARYEARVRDDHHHLVCRSCGAIADVDGAVGDTACRTAPDGSGYEVDGAEVIFWGRCPECVAATTSSGWRHQPFRGTGETGKRDRRDRDIRPERQDHVREHQRERESRDPEPYSGAIQAAADEPGLVAESAGPVGPPPARAPTQSDGR